MVKEMHPQSIKEATDSVLPVWLDAFRVLLNMDPREDVASEQNWDRLAIRIQIFRVRSSHAFIGLIGLHMPQTLDTLHTTFPRALRAYLPDFLAASLGHLQGYFPAYVQYYLAADNAVPKNSEDESIELPEVVAPIVDFVAAVARAGKAKEWYTPEKIGALVEMVFAFAQISIESVGLRQWGKQETHHLLRKRHGARAQTRSSTKKGTLRSRTASALLDSTC